MRKFGKHIDTSTVHKKGLLDTTLAFLIGLFLIAPVNSEPLSSQVNTGTDIPVMLDSRIVGSSSSKLLEVKGHVASDVFEDGKLCVPANSLILGVMACVNQRQKVEKFFLNFNKLQLADGTSFDIHATPFTNRAKFRLRRQNCDVSFDAGMVNGPTVLNDCPLTPPALEISVRPRLEQFILEPGDTFNIQLNQTLFFRPQPTNQ